MNYITYLLPEYFKPQRRPRSDNSHKYKKTVIYELRSRTYPYILYIGHTIVPEKRLQQHKNEALTNKNNHLKSRYMRLIGVDDFQFKALRTFSCQNRIEAELVEMDYIKRFKPPMNTEFVTQEQKILNEVQYIEFSRKIEFSTIYQLGKMVLKFLGVT